MTAGVIIRTFLVDGDPDGLRTLELSNSTVLATVFPRAALDRFLSRDPAKRPGVYLLVGPDPDDDRNRLYVGEAEATGTRLRRHNTTKDFWEVAVVFTSKDDYLTKTQVQYLESRLVAEATRIGKVVLDNGNVPNPPRISEGDQAEVEGFMAHLRLLLGAAGFGFLRSRVPTRSPRPTAPTAEGEQEDVFVYTVRGAAARLVRGESTYTVLAGSKALDTERPSAQDYIRRLRAELVSSGILQPDGQGLLQFTSDAEFESASGAACAVAGGHVNGRELFKRERDGKTLKAVEEDDAAAADLEEVGQIKPDSVPEEEG